MATYYIKTGGNDSLSGTSDANAWATIAKVNDYSQNTGFVAGDNILFNRGDTFTVVDHVGGADPYDDAVNNCQGLRIQQSGTSGSPITIGAYGTGARPIINGRKSIRGWNTSGNWTESGGVGSHIWRMVGSIWHGDSYLGRGRLWINGTEVRMADSEGAVTATQPYSHSGDNNMCYLYIYSTSNPATAFSNIEDQGWSNYGITFYQINYQTLQNIEVRGNNHAVVVSGSDNIIIEDCTIGLYCCMQGIFVDGDDYTGSTHANNGIIRRCTLETGDTQIDEGLPAGRPNTEDGILIRNRCDNWEVYENNVTNWSHACIGIYTIEGRGAVTNILVHDNFCSAPNVDYSIGIAAAASAGDFTNIQIYNNEFYDIPNENQLDSRGISFYNNIIDTVRGVAWAIDWPNERFGNGLSIESSSLVASSDPEYIEVYNNTIVNCVEAGITIRYWNAEDKKNNLIRNNLLYNNNTGGETLFNPLGRMQLQFEDVYPPEGLNTIKGNTYQNNLLYYPGATSSTELVYNGHDPNEYFGFTIANFNSFTSSFNDVISGNILGQTADDLFVDYANRDYHIKTTSVAYHAGMDVNLTTDYDGNARTETTPSIGAFEGEGEAPSGTIITITKVKIHNWSIL